MKLTRPQKNLLQELRKHSRFPCVERFAPARKLVELGFAVWTEGKYTIDLMITDKGREIDV